MKTSLPGGSAHGWGIAGDYLRREIAGLPAVDGVTLHCVRGWDLQPFDPSAWDRINIGYCFFEDNIEVLAHARDAAKRWDFMVAGSRWCEHNLRIGGFKAVGAILQGIDPRVFHPAPGLRPGDRFVVFSGGKFELRKGQDIVIAAMKVFMDRHDDVVLSCAWHNQWPFSLKTMELSSIIRYRHVEEDCLTLLRRTLAENGIDTRRVHLHPLRENTKMREIYLASDIGLFPNRCEGGNNMVMCEYMACGRTVIASDMTGHADVITSDNALPLTRYQPYLYEGYGRGIWFEPDLEEVIESLETAYTLRHQLHRKGMFAAEDMARLSWSHAAQQFHEVARQVAEGKS
jgi:glycosyltransferase involved in cell wall biosynthesis